MRQFIPFKFMLLVLFAVLAAYSYRLSLSTEQAAKARFEQRSERVIQGLNARIDQLTQGLLSARTLPMIISNDLKPNHFRLYMSQRHLREEFPAAFGFGYIRRLAAADVASFVEEQQQYRPDFQIQSLGAGGEEYFIVQYIEPLASNRAAIGLNLASEKKRRAAALRAMKSNAMALSEKLELARDGHAEAGFLMLLPYYLRPLEGVTPTEAERQDSLLGWVYAPISLTKLLAGLDDLAENRIDYAIYAGDELKPQHLLFASQASALDVTAAAFTRRVELELGGQLWTVILSTSSTFQSPLERWLWLLVFGFLLAGLLLGVLLMRSSFKQE